MAFVVRSQLAAGTLMGEVRDSVQSVDAEEPLYEMGTMTGVVQYSFARQRLQSFIVSFFALAALLMAMLGVDGGVCYSCRQRTVEIGTRMALGATSRDLLRLVVGDGLTMAAYGIGIGGAAIAAAVWLLSARVFGIHIDDPRPFLFSRAAVAGLTAIACFFPAWRATFLSPMVAICNEPAKSSPLRVAAHDAVGEHSVIGEAELLAEIAETGRHANSFADASRLALECLRDQLSAAAASLFVQRAPGRPSRCSGVDQLALPADALILSRLRHYSGAVPLDQASLDATARWARDNAPVHLAEIATLRKVDAALIMRVAVKDEISGLLFLGQPVGRSAYSTPEKRLLRGVSAQFAMMIENSRLTERIVEQERLRRELLLAAEVQMRLFPENSPDTASLQLFGVCLPARGVGGDYYDFLHLDDRRIGIALADVAGKGIAAALLMSVVQASLRRLAASRGPPLPEPPAKSNRQ